MHLEKKYDQLHTTLVPMNRGILVTAYATLKKDVTYEEVKAIYDNIMKMKSSSVCLDKDVCPRQDG